MNEHDSASESYDKAINAFRLLTSVTKQSFRASFDFVVSYTVELINYKFYGKN